MRKTISLYDWCRQNLKPTDAIPTGLMIRSVASATPLMGRPLVKGAWYTTNALNPKGKWMRAYVWLNAGDVTSPWSIDNFEVDVYEKQKGLKSRHPVYEEL